MRVLFLSPEFVWPADRGLRVRALSQLRVISAIPEVTRITFVSLTDAEIAPDRLRALEAAVPKLQAAAPIPGPARVRSSGRSLLRFARLRLLHQQPYLVAQGNSPAMHARLRSLLAASAYDVVYLGYIGMAAYLPVVRAHARGARVVLEEHNVEWRIFDVLASSLAPPMRQVVRGEALALRRFERRLLRAVDSVIAISDADAEGLAELSGVSPVVVRPFVEPGRPRVEAAAGPHLGYIGHLGWQPNTLGLDWFCREVWPLLRQRVPAATLTIAGPGLPKGPDGALAVPRAWCQPGVRTVGFVESLQDIYGATLGMVAPVVGGSGVRMKLLETMSAGMATVTTPDGAAGLGVTHGREVLIAGEPAAFVESVVRVLSDASLRARLREAGYAFLAERHSERAAVHAVRRAFAMSGG